MAQNTSRKGRALLKGRCSAGSREENTCNELDLYDGLVEVLHFIAKDDAAKLFLVPLRCGAMRF
jgi:hypothetical protein